MNNGSFFPNMNNTESANNMSLNTMNMQSMNMDQMNQTIPQTPNMNPTMPAAPSFPTYSEPVAMPEATTNSFNPVVENNVEIPVPSQAFQSEMVMPTAAPMPEVNNSLGTETPQFNNPVVDIPIINDANYIQEPVAPATPNQFEVPQQNSFDMQPLPQAEPAVLPEAPLFNQELNTMPQENIAAPDNYATPMPAYETPVTTPVAVEETPVDKLTEVQQLLTNSGVAFKTYSNESGHCIIIEL